MQSGASKLTIFLKESSVKQTLVLRVCAAAQKFFGSVFHAQGLLFLVVLLMYQQVYA